MSRRFRPLAVVGLCWFLTGCEPLHHQEVRSNEKDELPIYLQEPAQDPSLQRPEELQGFFKPNRTSGAWSSEAREIERSLGAIP